MLNKNRFETPRDCPIHILDLITKANRAADKLYCLESNLSKVDWHDFDELEYEIEQMRKLCDELSEKTRRELHKWHDEQRNN